MTAGRPCRGAYESSTMPRARKTPPVHIPVGCKFCFRCSTVKLHAAFATDRKTWDGKRADCRVCDSAAATLRDKLRREHRKASLQTVAAYAVRRRTPLEHDHQHSRP